MESFGGLYSWYKKSQHGCVRRALREHLTQPCCDFTCGGLEDHHKIILYYAIMFINIINFKGGGHTFIFQV